MPAGRATAPSNGRERPVNKVGRGCLTVPGYVTPWGGMTK